jgi:two-component system CheB/CheR fusion protein
MGSRRNASVKSTIAPAPIAFPIVAIGASAGGLEALDLFFTHVPADSGMAFVVIQHLDPDYKGIMPELLQRTTAMPVAQAKNRVKVLPDHVYVIPPNKDLSILHGNLYLLDPVAPRGLRLPIDFFLRSLADDLRNLAVGVILSGMGSDGTLGVRAIKENGGLVLVQDPASAKFDGMPQSAIDTGQVDIIAPAEELPLRIQNFFVHVRTPGALSPFKENETEAQKSGFDKVCILLRARTRHDFSHYKKTTVYRRIERRMAIHQLKRIADYVRYLGENPQEVDLLFKELLIGVTSFFRDPEIWKYLREDAIPDMLSNLPEGTTLRAWVAGCSTGEEAYSLAITFSEVLKHKQLAGKYTLQIFATDLDADAIDKARQAIYPANIAADVSEERLAQYFKREGNGYRVSKEMRGMVVFAPQNLIMDPPFTKLDILTCRNLLIYLDAELQKKLLLLFHYSLKPDGLLMLGSAESIGSYTDLFTAVEPKSRLFRRSVIPLRIAELEFPTRYLPSNSELAMKSTPTQPPVNLQTLADQLLLRQFSPAAVLVNNTGDLVYISGRTGKYLEPPTGKVNWNIHAMSREGLRQEIAIGLPKALRDNQDVIQRNLSVISDRSTQIVDLRIHPITEPEALAGMALIVFNDVSASPVPDKPEAGKGAPRRSPRVKELELAVSRMGQELMTLREEMQTSQEELKSANEELQSTNEELQSTNEELTTSKEEMQSMNEELQTVNIELQSKVDDLSAASNDMNNLLNSTNIATLFLDGALHIRRFTTPVTRIFKLKAGDVGRPLSDIVSDLVYPELPIDLEEVMRTLVFSDREITTTDGRWYQVKIMPYRTMDNVIDGVVMTFGDISVAKQLEAKLRATEGKSPLPS